MTLQGHVDPYLIHAQADAQPFSATIIDKSVSPYYMVSNITPFFGLESHLKAFRAQMLGA